MRTSRFDFGSGPDPDLADHWDTKRKLFSLAEVWALPNAVLVSDCDHFILPQLSWNTETVGWFTALILFLGERYVFRPILILHRFSLVIGLHIFLMTHLMALF